jgi:hypothetical protein
MTILVCRHHSSFSLTHRFLDWTKVKESNGVTTYYRHEEGSPMHSIKLEGTKFNSTFDQRILWGIIDAPLFNVLAVIYETELYGQWWPLLSVRFHFQWAHREHLHCEWNVCDCELNSWCFITNVLLNWIHCEARLIENVLMNRIRCTSL